jgi:magnesium transporter
LVLVSHFEDPEILPRIVERADCLGFHLYELEDPERHLDTSRGLRAFEVEKLLFVIGRAFVLTYHRGELDVVNDVREKCPDSFRLWAKSPGFLAFLFLNRCLYDYAHLNLANDNFLDGIEEDVLENDPEVADSIAIAGRNILTLKKLVASLQIVLMLLATERNPFISEESRPFYGDMVRNGTAVRAAIDSSRDLLDGILASVQARAAQRTGDIARVLTVVSTVVLPLSLIAGIYGMNFQYMPELRVGWAYWAVLAGMATLGCGLIGTFWRLGWLTRGGGGVRTRPPRARR